MNIASRLRQGLVLCFAVGALSACSRCEGCKEEAPTANDAGPAAGPRLTGVAGTVEFRPKSGSWQAGSEGQVVDPGTSVRTGPDGRVTVAFPDGSKLNLKAGSEVDLGGLEDEYQLLLDQGEVEVAAGAPEAQGFRVVFSDARDMAILREGHASLKKSGDGQIELSAGAIKSGGFRVVFSDASEMMVTNEGSATLAMKPDGVQVRVTVGEVTIQQSGETTSHQAGSSFKLRTGNVKIVAREAIPTTLEDKKRVALIRPPNSQQFTRPGASTIPLEPGTAVRTRGTGGAEWKDKSGGRVVLGPSTEASFEGSFRSDKGREGTLRLESGEARVLLRRDAKQGTLQEVVTPSARVVASAVGLTADVTISSRADSTQVTVRSGEAEVKVQDQSTPVKAGQSLTVGLESKESTPAPLPPPALRVLEGTGTRVFYDRSLSRLALAWKEGPPDEKVVLEVSSSPKFETLLLQEPVEGHTFAFDSAPYERYFWRLSRRRGQDASGTPGPVGNVELGIDPASWRRSPGALTNTVFDTGIQTKILFQGKAPALTFKWDEVKGSAGYLVRIYSEEDMEAPVLQENASASRLVLPAGKLKEGTYYWYQAALDTSGKESKASQMNKLVLAFDNAATLMRIDDPRPGEKPRNGKLETRGLAPPGSVVTANEAPVLISEDGRFDQVLSNLVPGSLLIFRLKQQGQGEVFFIRHLGD